MNSQQNISPAAQKSQRNRKLLGALFVFISAVSWGFSGTIAQFLTQECNVSVEWLNAVRMSGTGIILLPAALLIKSSRAELKDLARSKKHLRDAVIYAIFGAFGCQIGYLKTIAYVNSGTATMMEQLGMILVVAVTCITVHRMPTKREALALILALGGCFCICTHGNIGQLAMSTEGFLWGLFAAVGMATYVLLPVNLLKRFGSLTVTAFAMVVAGIFTCALFQPWNCMPPLTFEVVLGTLGTILLGTIVAYLLFLEGVKRVGAVVGGLLDAVEPVTAIVVSAVWLGTIITGFDVVGCILIIGMMILVTLPEKGASSQQ